MQKPTYSVAIIIINYNSSAFTIACVAAILEDKNATNYQIIVVDNASQLSDYNLLAQELPLEQYTNIQLHRSRLNTGFGGGNMLGVQFASAPYYLFLNNDTVVHENCIESCLRFMQENKDAGVCGPKMLSESGELQLGFDYFTCFAREFFGKKFVQHLYRKPARRAPYDRPLKVDYVNGSFMLFRAADFNQVGGFDTNLFLFYEESDICYRLKKNKKKTYYIPTVSYTHYQGESIKKTKMPLAIKLELKTSMFYVIRKHYGFLHYQTTRWAFALRYGITCLVKPKYFKLFCRIITGMPLSKSLKQQQIIQKA